jgi:hypothetical protein
MVRGLKNVPPTDAIGISSSLLATVGAAAKLPANAGKLAKAAATVVPDLHLAARAGHDGLVASLAKRDGVVIDRGSEVEDAKEVEYKLDRLVGALNQRLESLRTERAVGAEELRSYLFPAGVKDLTRLTGRPQRGRYDRWLLTWSERPARGSEADLDIAASLAKIEAEIERFGTVLDGKDTVSRGATGAIDGAGDAFVAWVDAMEELTLAVQIVLKTEPDRYRNWLAPYTEWRNAQAAARPRRPANADEPTVDDDVSEEEEEESAPNGSPYPESPGPQ